MITAGALHSVMCCKTCSTVTDGGKQYPRGTVFPPGVTATFWLKRKERITPADPSQRYPDLLGLSSPLLLSNTGTRNGVLFESHKMPRYRCILDGVKSYLVSDR